MIFSWLKALSSIWTNKPEAPKDNFDIALAETAFRALRTAAMQNHFHRTEFGSFERLSVTKEIRPGGCHTICVFLYGRYPKIDHYQGDKYFVLQLNIDVRCTDEAVQALFKIDEHPVRGNLEDLGKILVLACDHLRHWRVESYYPST